MADPCPVCGKNRVVVGYTHHCVPVSRDKPVTHAAVVTHAPAVTHKRERRADAMSGKERAARWRKAHGDDARVKHREYMKRWRAQTGAAP